MRNARPVVFLGPSLPLARAREILSADYRPPVQRGDLQAYSYGTVVAIIDGVFEQVLAVSPGEIVEALARGVVIYGGGSMGALRAAEVPGVVGVGQVYDWYRTGYITRDDEVALSFTPYSSEPLTVPSVAVRYAASRLQSSGTINPSVARAIVDAALALSFRERTYDRILELAGLASRVDGPELRRLLEAHDVKANDAQAVLEAIDLRSHSTPLSTTGPQLSSTRTLTYAGPAQTDAMFVWETGDWATQSDLREFLAFTGALFEIAQEVIRRHPTLTSNAERSSSGQKLLVGLASRWGWRSSEEVTVTLDDLRVGIGYVDRVCEAAAKLEYDTNEVLSGWTTPSDFSSLMFAEMLANMSLKREIMRYRSLNYFSEQFIGPITRAGMQEARTVVARLHSAPTFDSVQRRLEKVGLSIESVDVEKLARARQAARAMFAVVDSLDTSGSDLSLVGLISRPKPRGEARFGSPVDDAEQRARLVASRIGISRIGMIGELGDLDGIYVAQAARPGGAWSSSYGSGKSSTPAGAIIGSVMEECEKWAQEQVSSVGPDLVGSYSELARQHDLVDPSTLDVPHDSAYQPNLRLSWMRVTDLVNASQPYIPADALTAQRGRHDIFYSARGARKVFATNGLGAGFSAEEAILHGLCEVIERHAQRLFDVRLNNPGDVAPAGYKSVDPRSLSDRLQKLIESLLRKADVVRVVDITSEVQVPTFAAAVIRSGQIANGFGTHPNPEVAVEMALLEAAQTIASAIAGGREDLTIHARSLGRHERPRPSDPATAWFWMNPDAREGPLRSGYVANDVLADLTWCIEQAKAASVSRVLVCDLSRAKVEPVRVFRVIVPTLESNNPFHIGPRARHLLVRDLMPMSHLLERAEGG